MRKRNEEAVRKEAVMENEEKKSVAGKVVSILACVILVPVIIINLVIIFNGFGNSDKMPGFLGYRPAIILSGSMSPTFEAGDVILIKDVEDAAALQKGDVICYLIANKATTHRIIQVADKDGQTAYVTKGDFNNTEDRLAVMPEQIQGAYSGFRIPQLGNILMFMQSTQGIVICLGVPFALYVLYDVFKRRKDAGKKTAQLEAELAKLKAESENRSETAVKKETNEITEINEINEITEEKETKED